MVKHLHLGRAWRHWLCTHARQRRLFTPALLDELQAHIQRLEASHAGELELVIEAHLPYGQALLGRSSRERALEIFSHARVWDTEHNNGVLLYVLLADRAVEIVADRGFNALVAAHEWQAVCTLIRSHFQHSRWREGLRLGLDALAGLINRHFPTTATASHELPDRPILL
jgi:uncharacterized membrane protein